MAHGKSLELRKIPKRTVVVLHEHRTHTTDRYKHLGGVANRATRRAYARGRGRGAAMPAPTLLPYERPAFGSHAYEIQARLYAQGGAPVPVGSWATMG